MQNLEKKENMKMRDGEFATMMQQQEEEKAQKSMQKKQQAMTSTPKGKALILIHRVLSLNHFLQYSIPQYIGRRLKSNNPGNVQYVFLCGLFTPYTSGI